MSLLSQKIIPRSKPLKYLICIPCVNREEKNVKNVIQFTFKSFEEGGLFKSKIPWEMCLFESGSKSISYLEFIDTYREKYPHIKIHILENEFPLDGYTNTHRMFVYLSKIFQKKKKKENEVKEDKKENEDKLSPDGDNMLHSESSNELSKKAENELEEVQEENEKEEVEEIEKINNQYDFIVWMDDDVLVCRKFIENLDAWVRLFGNSSIFTSLYVCYPSFKLQNTHLANYAHIYNYFGTCCTIFRPFLCKFIVPKFFDFPGKPDSRFRYSVQHFFPQQNKIIVGSGSLVQHMNAGSVNHIGNKNYSGHRAHNFVGIKNDPKLYLSFM